MGWSPHSQSQRMVHRANPARKIAKRRRPPHSHLVRATPMNQCRQTGRPALAEMPQRVVPARRALTKETRSDAEHRATRKQRRVGPSILICIPRLASAQVIQNGDLSPSNENTQRWGRQMPKISSLLALSTPTPGVYPAIWVTLTPPTQVLEIHHPTMEAPPMWSVG